MITMYVSFCADSGTCTTLKNQWNRGGPCSRSFGRMCPNYWNAECGLGCLNQWTVISSGAEPRLSCQVGIGGCDAGLRERGGVVGRVVCM